MTVVGQVTEAREIARRDASFIPVRSSRCSSTCAPATVHVFTCHRCG